MKKKLLVTIMTLAIVASTVACGKELEPAKNNSADEASTAEVSEETSDEDASVEASDEASTESSTEDSEAEGNITGTINGSTYENEFFNIRIATENYKFASEEEVKALNSEVRDGDDDEAVKKAIDDGLVMVVASAQDPSQQNSLTVIVEKVGVLATALTDEKSVLEATKPGILSSFTEQGITDVTAEIENTTFLGEEHPSIILKASMSGVTVYSRTVCLIKSGYVSLYSITGLDSEAFDEVLSKAEKIK